MIGTVELFKGSSGEVEMHMKRIEQHLFKVNSVKDGMDVSMLTTLTGL